MTTGLLAVSANILAAAFLLPQIARLIRRRDGAGVSVTWAAFGVVTNAGWVFYLGRLGLWTAVIAPTLATVTYSLMLWVIASMNRRRTWMLASVSYAVCLGTVEGLGGAAALSLLLAITPAIQVSPALVAVFREKFPSGVSPVTWCLGATEAALWGLYGWMVSDTALVGYGLVTTAGSILILGRWLVTRDRFARTSANPRGVRNDPCGAMIALSYPHYSV